MIHFDDGSQGALAEAGYGADGELLVRGGKQKLIGIAYVAGPVGGAEAEFEARTLEKIARTSGMARGTAADADGVVTLRLEIEEGVKGGDAEDAGQRCSRFGCDVFERLRREVFMLIVLLDSFQDAEERSGTPRQPGDDLVDERTLRGGKQFEGWCVHGTPFKGTSTSFPSGMDRRPRGNRTAGEQARGVGAAVSQGERLSQPAVRGADEAPEKRLRGDGQGRYDGGHRGWRK